MNAPTAAPTVISRESFYAFIWDHATHEMAGVYLAQAQVTRLSAVGKFWDELLEDERVALRVAVRGMLEAYDSARASRRVAA